MVGRQAVRHADHGIEASTWRKGVFFKGRYLQARVTSEHAQVESAKLWVYPCGALPTSSFDRFLTGLPSRAGNVGRASWGSYE